MLIEHELSPVYLHIDRPIGLVGRVFGYGLGDLGSIPGRVILRTLKMVLDTSMLDTQQYKVRIKVKVEQPRERSCALSLHFGVVAIEKGTFWSPLTMVANNFIFISWWLNEPLIKIHFIHFHFLILFENEQIFEESHFLKKHIKHEDITHFKC